jgi:hypothetical protein
MKIHYFIKAVGSRFQVQESISSFGGENDHPAEILDGKVQTYGTLGEAEKAAQRCYHDARRSGRTDVIVTVNVAWGSMPTLVAQAIDTEEGPVSIPREQFRWLLNAAKIGANERAASADRKRQRLVIYITESNKPFNQKVLNDFNEAIAEAEAEHRAYWDLIRHVTERAANREV